MNNKFSKQSGGNAGVSFPLTLASPGERVQVVLIRGGASLKERLLSIGIQVADLIKVIQSREKGAVLVIKDENRFMLGGGMARKIYVRKE